MNRRGFLRGLLPLLGLLPTAMAGSAAARGLSSENDASDGDASNEENELTRSTFRLAFGSCCDQGRTMPIWSDIASARPDVFAFIGDNIYADTEDMDEMRAKYAQLAKHAAFAKFRARVPIIATWDDHDFGTNDGGAEYPMKEESKRQFLDFFGEPAESPRRDRAGVYTSYHFGASPRRVQVILLDLRWFRSPLLIEDGKYVPNPDPLATMLGEEQWQWLERELSMPADARIIASSTQFTSPIHPWEKWANFPHEKARLLELLDEHRVKNTFVISGDMHFAELSKELTPGGREILDLTSSGLNYYDPTDGTIENPTRLAFDDRACNFGLVTIDWSRSRVLLEARGLHNRILISHTVPLYR